MTRHVVLVTYGEPTTASFSEQLVYSWRILVGLTRTVAPIPRPLLPVIALLARAIPQPDVDSGELLVAARADHRGSGATTRGAVEQGHR